MSEIFEWARNNPVGNFVLGLILLVWGGKVLIKKGEKDPSASEEEMRRLFKKEEDFIDLCSNVKDMKQTLEQIKQILGQQVSLMSNDRQP